MFSVDTTNFTITMTRGDTGSFMVSATGHTFDDDDRALFTIKSASGEIVYEHAYELTDDTLGNGKFVVNMTNPMTDYLATGTYNWDVRYILHPYYDGNNRIVNGDQVLTPRDPMNINLKSAVGEV